MGQTGDGLQAQVRDFRAGCRLLFGGQFQTAEFGLSDGFLLDSDLLGIGDYDIEDAAADDGDAFFAVAGKGQFHRCGKGLETARRQDAVVGNLG